MPLGVGDEGVFVFTPAVQYDIQLSPQWAAQGKITANYASGNLGTATGAGDFFATAIYSLTEKRSWMTSFTAGAKVPLNEGNLKKNGQSLPMQYQSSLGTFDLIAGVSISNKRWQFSVGWQQPLSGPNGNQFISTDWKDEQAQKYPSTNRFNRKADALLRTAYTISMKNIFTITPGLLGIYHLAEDSYVDSENGNKSTQIEGSKGLTLNATVSCHWSVNNRLSIGVIAGKPLIARDIRPDGLTRSFAVSPEFRWSF